MQQSYVSEYLNNAAIVLSILPKIIIEQAAQEIAELKIRKGRLFIIGVGGSAANASHAVNDFRKISGIETYAPTDNVSELTARTNDQGWGQVFIEWLKTSKMGEEDCLLVLSVGGGSLTLSPNIVNAIAHAKFCKTQIIGIVSKDGGYTAKTADVVIKIPIVSTELTTPMAESFQSLILHLLATHPDVVK